MIAGVAVAAGIVDIAVAAKVVLKTLFIYVLCCVGDADDSVANSGCGHDNV